MLVDQQKKRSHGLERHGCHIIAVNRMFLRGVVDRHRMHICFAVNAQRRNVAA